MSFHGLMLMKAGKLFYHEEWIDGESEPHEGLQIFIRSGVKDLKPAVTFQDIELINNEDEWRLLASPKAETPLQFSSQTWIYDAKLSPRMVIIKGATRQFSVDESGAEHILQLAIEKWWIVDRDSFMNRVPSRYYIEAWEDTQLLLLPRNQLEVILEIPAIKSMFWQMSENNHIASQRRLDDTITLSAVKRYENFQHHYPEIIQRFPQHQIASYLGITRETLSRIRRQD